MQMPLLLPSRCDDVLDFTSLTPTSGCLERRQPELVSTVLLPEDAKQEAVHAQQYTTPEEHGKLLGSRVRNPWDLERERDCRESQNAVNSRDDLALQTELVAKATSEVADAALAVALYIGRLTDVIEHVAGGEEKDSDERESSPEVTVLQEREDVGRGHSDNGDTTKHGGGHGDDLYPVDGAGDLRLGDVGWELAGHPGMDLLGSLGAGSC